MNPRVSIVIPVYNGANYVAEAIDSALAQTYDNFEVIVVNDGSEDDGKTEEIARSFGDKVRYFFKKNGGQSSALNFGIEKMQGEYFSWLSHDDLYYPMKIEEQIKALHNKGKNVIVYSDFDLIDPHGHLLKTTNYQKYKNTHLAFQLLRYEALNANTLLVHKDLLEKVGFFNINRPHTSDVELIFRLSLIANFIYLPKSLVKNRRHDKQATKQKQKYHHYETDLYILWAITFLNDDQFKIIANNQNLKEVYMDLILFLSSRNFNLSMNVLKEKLKITYGLSFLEDIILSMNICRINLRFRAKHYMKKLILHR